MTKTRRKQSKGLSEPQIISNKKNRITRTSSKRLTFHDGIQYILGESDFHRILASAEIL